VRRRRIIRRLLLSDVAALLLATFGTTWLQFGSFTATAPLQNVTTAVAHWDIALLAAVLWLVTLWGDGLYNLERLNWGAGELSRVARALALGVVHLILLTYLLKMPGLSREWTVLAFGLSIFTVSAGRLLVRGWLTRLARAGDMHRRTLVVGDNAEAECIISRLASSPEQGMTPVGCLASHTRLHGVATRLVGGVPTLGHPDEIEELVREHEIDMVILAVSAFHHEELSRIISRLRGTDVTIHVSSGLFEILASRVIIRDVSGMPFMTVAPVALSTWNVRLKRAFDIAVASLGIVGGLPIWLCVMGAIAIDSRGPVFYRQVRIGKEGVEFSMYKFRSMFVDADARLKELEGQNEATGPLFKMKEDPRVTRVGKWLRKYSIDEFPQLLNVLRGDMSLVGPRPPLPREAVEYADQHWRRMEVLPGMTGLWQVSGRSGLSFDEMVRLDLYYIENWSLGFDLSILMRTIPAVLFARGAY